MLITPMHFTVLERKLSDRHNLFDALAQLKIPPYLFFQHLLKNPEDAERFGQLRMLAAERFIQDSISKIEKANDKFELDKAVNMFRASQWLGEKLIPKTYGARLEVNHNVSIDIDKVLKRAENRLIAVTSQVVSVESKNSATTIEDAEISSEDLIG